MVAVGVAKVVGSVALSTAVGAGMGYLQNGKDGAIDGACNGFLLGSFTAFCGAGLKLAKVKGFGAHKGGAGKTFKSQYEIPLDESGYTKSNLKLGRMVHKEYKVGEVNDITKFKEYILPSGRRVDFIDFETKTIYELEPFNPRQIESGTKQLQIYLQEVEEVFGEGWTTVLDTY